MNDVLTLDEIKITTAFALSVVTKRQLADLKHATEKDMSLIVTELVAAEHARQFPVAAAGKRLSDWQEQAAQEAEAAGQQVIRDVDRDGNVRLRVIRDLVTPAVG